MGLRQYRPLYDTELRLASKNGYLSDYISFPQIL